MLRYVRSRIAIGATLAVSAVGTCAAADTMAGAYLTARHALENHDYTVAADAYARLMDGAPEGATLSDAAITSHVVSGAFEVAVDTAAPYVSGADNPQIPRLVAMADRIRSGRWAEVSALLDAGPVVGVQLDQIIGAWAMVERGAATEGAAALEAMLEDEGFGALAGHHLALVKAGEVEAGPAISEVLLAVAQALEGHAKADYVLLYCRLAEVLAPDSTQAIFTSANMLHELRQYDLAVETLMQVPASDASYLDAQLKRARVLRDAGRIEDAVSLVENIAAVTNDVPRVHEKLGNLYRHVDRYADARAAYDRALELQGDMQDWYVLYTRAIISEELGEWDKAEADLRAALKLSPDQPYLLNYLGYALVEQDRNLTEALSMIEAAVEAKPENGYIRDSLGWAYFKLGNMGDAVTHMERAVELEPMDPTINDHLGDVYWTVGREAEARFQWSRALSLNPSEEAKAEIVRKLDHGLDLVDATEALEVMVTSDES
ncbi:MAG: tetratricopeptide repeat protein [Pseudomonadota bacterium]